MSARLQLVSPTPRLPPPLDPAPAEAHVVFEGVRKEYAGSAGTKVQALGEVSFSIARGEVFGIIGRSGAGKSTLLRAINMLEPPSGGRVLVDGVDVGNLDDAGLLGLRRRVGMIFQHFNLLSAKTVRDNVGLPLRVAGVKPAEVRERVDALLALVGLSDKADTYPAKLSGGQKQRVGIARALVHRPAILLCDEATSALDPETTQSILALLRDINRDLGLTVVLITHDMAVIREVCTRVLVLDDGTIAEQGPVWQVFGDPQAAATRALLRPLQHELPADIARRLVPSLGGRAGQVVLALQFTGDHHSGGVPLAALAALGPGATLLHGGLDRIDGHGQGRLLVLVPAAALSTPSFQSARVGDIPLANHIEILGYVPASVG
jgi:D-methionine transport system ATP-binding protein